jgi:hypothetical protein
MRLMAKIQTVLREDTTSEHLLPLLSDLSLALSTQRIPSIDVLHPTGLPILRQIEMTDY